MFITITDKENKVILSYEGTVAEKEPIIMNNNYKLFMQKAQPIFNATNEDISFEVAGQLGEVVEAEKRSQSKET